MHWGAGEVQGCRGGAEEAQWRGRGAEEMQGCRGGAGRYLMEETETLLVCVSCPVSDPCVCSITIRCSKSDFAWCRKNFFQDKDKVEVIL